MANIKIKLDSIYELANPKETVVVCDLQPCEIEEDVYVFFKGIKGVKRKLTELRALDSKAFHARLVKEVVEEK